MQATHRYVARPTCSLSPCCPAHTRRRRTPPLSRLRLPLCRSRAAARSGAPCDAVPRCLRQQQQRCSPPLCPNRMQRTAPRARARDGAVHAAVDWDGQGAPGPRTWRRTLACRTGTRPTRNGEDGKVERVRWATGSVQVSFIPFPASIRDRYRLRGGTCLYVIYWNRGTEAWDGSWLLRARRWFARQLTSAILHTASARWSQFACRHLGQGL